MICATGQASIPARCVIQTVPGRPADQRVTPSMHSDPGGLTARDGSFVREWLHQLDPVAERIVDIDPPIAFKELVISDGDFGRL